VWGLEVGFELWGVGFWVLSLGFGVWGLGSRVWGIGVQGLCGVQGFRDESLGFRA